MRRVLLATAVIVIVGMFGSSDAPGQAVAGPGAPGGVTVIPTPQQPDKPQGGGLATPMFQPGPVGRYAFTTTSIDDRDINDIIWVLDTATGSARAFRQMRTMDQMGTKGYGVIFLGTTIAPAPPMGTP